MNILDVFAFENRERNGERHYDEKRRGWGCLDWKLEFARQGIGSADRQMWKITDFNKSYQVSSSKFEFLINFKFATSCRMKEFSIFIKLKTLHSLNIPYLALRYIPRNFMCSFCSNYSNFNWFL